MHAFLSNRKPSSHSALRNVLLLICTARSIAFFNLYLFPWQNEEKLEEKTTKWRIAGDLHPSKVFKLHPPTFLGRLIDESSRISLELFLRCVVFFLFLLICTFAKSSEISQLVSLIPPGWKYAGVHAKLFDLGFARRWRGGGGERTKFWSRRTIYAVSPHDTRRNGIFPFLFSRFSHCDQHNKYQVIQIKKKQDDDDYDEEEEANFRRRKCPHESLLVRSLFF